MSILAKNPLRFVLPVLALSASLIAQNAKAVQSYYWDINGTAAGAGGATPAGLWEGVFWATTSTGTATTGTWGEGGFPRFAAGTDATGSYTVTANSDHRIAGAFIATGSGTVTVNGTGVLSIDGTNGIQQGFFAQNSSFLRIFNKLTGAGGIVSSSGQLFLENTNNDFKGGVAISTGLLNFGAASGNSGNGNVFGTNGIGISSTGTALIAETNNLVVTNTFTNQINNAGLNLSSVGTTWTTTYSGDWYLNGNTLLLGAGGGTGDTVVLSGAIKGTGGLSRQSSTTHGTLKLTSTNSTFSGKTTLSSSVTAVQSINSYINNQMPSSSLGTPTPNAEANAAIAMGATTFTGTLLYQGPGETTDREIVMAGTTGGATIQNDGTGPLVFTSGSFPSGTGAKTLTLSGSGVGTFQGFDESGIGPVSLTKSGAGLWTLNSSFNYSGITTVGGGTLVLPNDNTIPSASQVTLTVTNTILDFQGHNQNVAALSGKGVITNHTATLSVSGNSSTTLFNAYSSFNGPVYSTGSIIKSGTGAMSIHSTNFYNTPFGFQGGVLSVGAGPNRLPPTTAIDVPGGSIFQLDANSQTLTNLSNSGLVNLGGGTLTIAQPGFVSFSGTIEDSELAGSSVALGHGLRGYYYDNPDFTTLLAVRDDATVNFTDLTSAAQLPTAVFASSTNFTSIRWLGQILSETNGTYTFSITADDGKRLWVNGVLVIDAFVSGSSTVTGTIALAANTRYDIVMEYYNGTGTASAKLAWIPPGDTVASVVPTDNLFLPGPGNLVLNGGFVTLSGASTYSGGTTVTNVGSLIASVDNALGKGNVNLSNGSSLTLNTTAGIAATADLILGGSSSSVALNGGGTTTIHGFSVNGGSSYLAVGTYGGSGAGAAHTLSQLSGSGILNVTAGPAGNVLSASSLTTTYGTPVTFTSTITGSGATPTGTVTFYDAGNAIGTTTVDGTGHATLTINLSVITSPHVITSVYNGDSSYLTANSSASVSVTVTPVTVSFGIPIAAASRAYNGTNTVTITAATASVTNLVGVLTGDTNNVRLSTTAFYTDKNIGTGKSVTGLTLTGSLAGNYVLASTTAANVGNITAKALTVTGITSGSKVYDGTTSAVINTNAAVLVGAVVGDDVTLNLSGAVGTFATATVGTGKVVTINGLTVTGADAGNYVVTAPTVSGLAITQASTTEGLTSSLNPSTPGASVTFTATPTPVPPGAGVPTGSIVFLTNSVPVATNALVSGTITFITSTLPAGTNTVTAQYAGDANFIGSTNALSQVVSSVVIVPSTNIVITPSGSNAVLSWTGTGVLQASSNVASNYVDVPSAVSPYTSTNTGTNQFFRLRN